MSEPRQTESRQTGSRQTESTRQRCRRSLALLILAIWLGAGCSAPPLAEVLPAEFRDRRLNLSGEWRRVQPRPREAPALVLLARVDGPDPRPFSVSAERLAPLRVGETIEMGLALSFDAKASIERVFVALISSTDGPEPLIRANGELVGRREDVQELRRDDRDGAWTAMFRQSLARVPWFRVKGGGGAVYVVSWLAIDDEGQIMRDVWRLPVSLDELRRARRATRPKPSRGEDDDADPGAKTETTDDR